MIQHAMEGSGDRVAASRAGLEAFLGYYDQHRTLRRIIRQAEFVDPTLFHDYYGGLTSAYSAALQASPGTDNSTRSDPTALAHCVMGVADAMTMRWPDAGWAEETRETGLRFVENGVRGAAAPKQKKSKKRERDSKPSKHAS